MKLVDALIKTISLNQEERAAARHYLENKIATEFDELTLALSRIMADEWQGAAVGMQAAEELLNVLYSPQIEQQRINEERWLQLHGDIRDEIKAHCCDALDMPEQYRHSAAQCVARIACIELPGGHWPEVINILVANFVGETSTEALKQASLEAIGYIDIEDWKAEPDYIGRIFEPIFVVLYHGHNNDTRLAAARALRIILIMATPYATEFVCCEIIPRVCERIFPSVCRSRRFIEDTEIVAEWKLELVRFMMEFFRRRFSQVELRMQIDLIRHFVHCDRYRRIQENALLAFKALILAFSEYLDDFMTVLLACLENFAQPQICSIAIGILGDLAHQVAPKLEPYLDKVFLILFNTTRNPTAARSLLPQIISAFGDFALLLGDSFTKYRGQVIEAVKRACEDEVNRNDPDIDFFNLFGQSCIEAFVGLIIGAAAQEKIDNLGFFVPYLPFIINFMKYIAGKQGSSDELIGACCELVGDIATCFENNILQRLDKVFLRMLLNLGRNSESASTQRYAALAIKAMKED